MAHQGATPVSHEVGVLHYGMTPLRAQYAAITASASGATTLVNAPPTGYTIVVLSYCVTCGATANTVNFQSHTTTTVGTGAHALAINGTVASGYCPAGLFACVPSEALDINLTGATAVGGELTFVVIPPYV